MSTLPLHFSSHHPQGIALNQTVAQFELGSQRNFVYLILDWELREAAIVDPQSDVETPLRALQEHQFKLTQILLTHTHADHTAGVPGLVARFPELPVRVHPEDLHRISRIEKHGALITPAHDNACFKVGSIEVQLLHTPGHSAGECCYFLTTDRPYLLTGDTIFIRDCGRTDFPDGSNEQMFASLARIKTLPPETVILPGHHYAPECASTLDKELQESPPMRCRTVQELASLP